MKEAKHQVLAQAPTPEDLEDTLVEEGKEEGQSEVSAAPGIVGLPDLCALSDAKGYFPVRSLLLLATGVPESFISDNTPQGPDSPVHLLLPLWRLWFQRMAERYNLHPHSPQTLRSRGGVPIVPTRKILLVVFAVLP